MIAVFVLCTDNAKWATQDVIVSGFHDFVAHASRSEGLVCAAEVDGDLARIVYCLLCCGFVQTLVISSWSSVLPSLW